MSGPTFNPSAGGGGGSGGAIQSGSLTLPASITSRFGIRPGLKLSYKTAASSTTPVPTELPPHNAAELYAAIGNARSAGQIDEAQYNALVSTFFTPDYQPGSKDAGVIDKAVTAALDSTGGNLANYAEFYKPPITKAVVSINGGGLATAGLGAATASQVESSYGVVSQYLENWGLGNVDANKVLAIITNYGDQVTNTDELLEIVRGNIAPPPTIGGKSTAGWQKQFQDSYNAAFPGLASYNKNAASTGNVRLTEGQYQSYAARIQDEATQYGAPMPTGAQIGQLLNNNVSASEYQQRVQDFWSAYQNADQNVINILQNQYGLTQGNIMNYMITGVMPNAKGQGNQGLPGMQRAIANADIQDYTQRVGLGGLTSDNYNQLAQMAKLAGTTGNQGLGYGVSQIEGSVQNAARDVALTQNLPGQTNPTVNTQTLIAAQLAGFGGVNQIAAQTQVARAEQAKVAPFEKGGGYAESAKGVVGLGSART